ncbi:2Fe-2S iron-sulfur cluster-binding protein [Salinisphaera sp. G21_0]|uniref:2Fe-2S iron-sulfur cluster-binding protein n=1 Tax=Salinisphaera sp. G21_0 TaxID=2821094 RepID=UPI001ADA1A1E|nr:2Fe-2S iron-sulfur cluster-binding protein [Salinisphaera sp. G21_0]MBO9482819.1 (2Fe-2S)-binding protein [Salinisphaera sp. G21_0]
MPLIQFVTHDGNQYEADIDSGSTLMQGAVDNMIDGILAECGGACSCATCHCYIDEGWAEIVGPAEGMEQEMLDVVREPRETSRLSCQIVVTDEMDGMVVHLPESQY